MGGIDTANLKVIEDMMPYDEKPLPIRSPGLFPDISGHKFSNIDYRDLKFNINMVAPGGRGGPGPSQACHKRKSNLLTVPEYMSGLET